MVLSQLSGGGNSTAYVGGGGGVTALQAVPAAPFANTNYGFDPSVENNYGLGHSFVSTAVARTQMQAASSGPSLWWLILFVVLWVVWR